jgi:hypothetical protein
MIHYTIANHLIQVSGTGINQVFGFLPFVSTNHTEREPILQVQLGVPLLNWDIAPLQQFFFGEDQDVPCSFAVNNGVYLLRMEQPEATPSLLTVTKHKGCFIAKTNMDNQSRSDLLRFACWIAFGIACVHHQTLAIHASTLSYEGKSILFLGESGTGKSTHTRLWLDHIAGTELLNDDSPFVRILDDRTVSVFGSPWSGKTPCYKNIHTPVAAIVRLSQAPYNRIKLLKGIAALGALLPSCPPAFAYDETLMGHITGILSTILQQVPVYALECLPNREAAYLVHKTVMERGFDSVIAS